MSLESFTLDHMVHQLLGADKQEQLKSALFILNLKEIRCLSESAIEHIVNETDNIFQHNFGRFQAGFDECLSRNENDPSSITGLTQFCNSVENPFEGLHTKFLHENFYRDNLGCIVSCCAYN